MKFGVRIEPVRYGLFLGIGYTWLVEKAFVICLLNYEIHIGVVYG